VRYPSHSNEDRIDRDGPLLLAAAQVNHFLLTASLDTSDVAAENELQSIPVESLLYSVRGIAIFLRENLIVVGKQVDLSAEAGKSLGQLTADGAGPNNREAARQLRQRENCLVGEKAGLGQSGDGRTLRSSAGSDDGLLEAKHLAGHLDCVRTGEAR